MKFLYPRSSVFWKTLEFMKFHNPSIVIFENVKNLQSHNNGKTFKLICDSIKEQGYFIKHKILNTSTITNIPQHRERIYIVCFRNESDCNNFNLDFPTLTNKNLIKDCLESNVNAKYYYTNKSQIYPQLVNDIKKKVSENAIYQYRRVYVRENKSNECPLPFNKCFFKMI